MDIDILSLFPDYFESPLKVSILGKAIEAGLVSIKTHDIRDYSEDKHLKVDDKAYGGGPGMVMMPGPVTRAIRKVQKPETTTLYLSPAGKPLDAELAKELAQKKHLVLLAGHYEGVDQRVIDQNVDQEVSVGDFVLTNGCLAALVLIDAVTRFIPHVVGDIESVRQDSFENHLLDYPHFTLPRSFEGLEVPDVLLSGDHSKINKWRSNQSHQRTKERRPDLYAKYLINQEMTHNEVNKPFNGEVYRLSYRLKCHKWHKRVFSKELGLLWEEKTGKMAALKCSNLEIFFEVEERSSECLDRPFIELKVRKSDWESLLISLARVLKRSKPALCERSLVIERTEQRATLRDPEGITWVFVAEKS